MSKPKFEKNFYELPVTAPERFDPVKMFAPQSGQDTGVHILFTDKKISELSFPVNDSRTRFTAHFSRVTEGLSSPSKVYAEFIKSRGGAEQVSVPPRVLHTVLRIYGNVNTANGLGQVIPSLMFVPLIVPHYSEQDGWVVSTWFNSGGRINPTWSMHIDQIKHSKFNHRVGSVIMTIVP